MAIIIINRDIEDPRFEYKRLIEYPLNITRTKEQIEIRKNIERRIEGVYMFPVFEGFRKIKMNKYILFLRFVLPMYD